MTSLAPDKRPWQGKSGHHAAPPGRPGGKDGPTGPLASRRSPWRLCLRPAGLAVVRVTCSLSEFRGLAGEHELGELEAGQRQGSGPTIEISFLKVHPAKNGRDSLLPPILGSEMLSLPGGGAMLGQKTPGHWVSAGVDIVRRTTTFFGQAPEVNASRAFPIPLGLTTSTNKVSSRMDTSTLSSCFRTSRTSTRVWIRFSSSMIFEMAIMMAGSSPCRYS